MQAHKFQASIAFLALESVDFSPEVVFASLVGSAAFSDCLASFLLFHVRRDPIAYLALKSVDFSAEVVFASLVGSAAFSECLASFLLFHVRRGPCQAHTLHRRVFVAPAAMDAAEAQICAGPRKHPPQDAFVHQTIF